MSASTNNGNRGVCTRAAGAATAGESSPSRQQDEDDEISPPLFVRIQTIDLQSLDFQTNIGSAAKFRHLTCIEATNLFLFVGSTSGSVYVFSRDTLKFLFMIPFKGGKVCSIACSQDESEIAVGSIRGKVSIYRISPNVHYMQSVASAPLIDAFRDLVDVPHHTGSEITEMQWSPNGKYLFVGDSQGIVSQLDVACLDEFPRPIPSKVILKLQTRVLQIDCSFPFLAVCTLAAVFLCDLEKEDFTRVQCTKNVDIRSTGLCLMILPERSSLRDLAKERTIPSAKLILFIGEVGSGTLHCCNMEGSIQYSKKIAISGKVSKYSMPVFDPTKTPLAVVAAAQHTNGLDAEGKEEANSMQTEEEDEEQVNISLGKMLCTDDGMIVSVSSDRLYVYDPYTLNVIAWNEEFKRINNFKIISNYAFIWAGSKLEVVAFTPFRSYAEQLYRAKLTGVLENWIVHTVYSLGWRHKVRPSRLPPLLSTEAVEQETQQSYSPELTNGSTTTSSSVCSTSCAIDEVAGKISSSPALASVCVNSGDKTVRESKAVWNFRKMLLSEGDEESEFTQFVASHVPFPISVNSLNSCEESSAEQEQQDLSLMMADPEEMTIERPLLSFLKDCQSLFGSLDPPQPQRQVSATSSDNLSAMNTSQVQPSTVNDIGRIACTLSHMLKRGGEKDYLQLFSQVWKSLLTFYEDIEVVLPQLDYKKSELTLSHVLNASQTFITQPKLVNICEKIGELSASGGVNGDIFTKVDDIITKMIFCLYCQQNQFKKCSTDLLIDPQAPSSSNLFMLCFTKFSHCPLVIQWFRELGTSPETLFYDGLLADTLLLLFPLCSTKNDGLLLSSCLDSIGIYDKLPKFFMTWLFLCKFLHKPRQVPYSPLLRSLLNDQLFEKLAEEMFSTIYRDFRLSSFGNAAHYLHHFVSALVLLSKSPECDHPRNVSVLLSCFPLIKWAREDIVTKIIAACHLNPALLGLYLKACLEDGNSLSLCACGLQAGYGSLEDKISPWQRAIEEAVIKLLLEEYFKSSPYDDEEESTTTVPDGNGNGTQKRRAEMLVHMFAMRRGLLEPYFRSPLPDEFLSEEMQAELVVRSGNCASLKYYQCNETNMSLLLTSYRSHFLRRRQKSEERRCGALSTMKSNGASGDTSSNIITKYGGGASCKRVLVDYDFSNTDNRLQSKRHLSKDFCFGGDVRVKGSGKCFKCSYPLKMFKRNFKPMSRDCLGMWALKQMGSLERLIEVVQTCQLNSPAIFSARFYQAVVKFSDGTHQGAGLSEYDPEFGTEHSFTCAIFH